MVLGHHMFLNIVLKICKIQMELLDYSVNFNVFLSCWATEGMAPNPEPLGLLWNEKFVQLLEAVGTRNMQWRLRSTQGWAAFCVGLLALSMQMSSYIHYNTGVSEFPSPEDNIGHFLALSWIQLIIS